MGSLNIINQTENPLFNRKELEVTIESNTTPKIKEAEEIITKEFSASPESVKIKKINGKFGSSNFVITANIYHSKEDKDKTERKTKKEKEADAKALSEVKSEQSE